MKSILRKISIEISIILLIIGLVSSVYATNLNTSNYSEEDLRSYLKNLGNIEAAEIVGIYTELTEEYSNQEIANMVKDNKEAIISKTGIDEETLKIGINILSTLDTEEIREILEEDLDIEEIQKKLNNGYTINQVIQELQEQMSTKDKVSIAIRILLASSIVKTILMVLTILIIYKIIIRWIIFRKADEHGWASIIPIYSEITYLNVCGISPWWILILFIPILGVLIYGIVKIIARFTLAESFNKGIGFGFGLLLLGIVFESVIAFNKNIRYVEYE